jgi:N-acetylglucosamine-6-sulfatase
MLSYAEVLKSKPVWAEAFERKGTKHARNLLAAIGAGTQEEIRQRARMMAAVDEGVGAIFEALERTGQLDDTLVLFLSDNGYFFGEHGLGPERRFAYEEGIRSPFLLRFPRKAKAGARFSDLVICQDIAPTLLEMAGGRPGCHVQGRSLMPLLAGRRAGWRKSILIEYWAENAMPWLIGMSYKAIRTDRYKYIRWLNRARDSELDELYDLDRDPYELRNLNRRDAYATVRSRLRAELRRLVADATGV